MSRSRSQIKSLLDAWEILMRFRWRFMVPAFLVAAAVLVASLMLPRKYEAEAIFERRTDTVLTDIMNRNASASVNHARQSMVQEISGAPAIDALTSRLAPWLYDRAAKGGPRVDLEALRTELERSILVRYDIFSPSVDRVRVSYIGSDSELARKVVNTLVENYLAGTRAQIDQRLKESTAFFEAEVARSRKAIEQQENLQLTYEIKHGELLPENPNGVQTSLGDVQNQLTDVNQKLEAATIKLAAMEKTLDATPKTLPSMVRERNPDYKALQDKLHELQNTESQDVDALKMTAKHPDLVALRAEIAKVQDQIAHTDPEVVTQKQTAVNPVYAQLEMMVSQARADQQALQRQTGVLQAHINALNAQTQQLFPVRAEYRKLTRDVEQNQRQLAFWEDNLRKVKMATSAEAGNRGVSLEFIKPCDVLRLPVSPDLAQVLMAALALGLACGGVSVVAAHRGDESFHDGEQLADGFSLPLFGSVSEIISRRQQRMRAARNMILYPINAVAMALVLAALTYVVYVSLRAPSRAAPVSAHTVPAPLSHPASQPSSTQPSGQD